MAITPCQAGWSIYFTTIDDLVQRLRAAEATGRFNHQLQACLRPSVLVVDEVGYLPMDWAEANMVFQLVARRYERGTMISSAESGCVLGDEVRATAILDRLLHHCEALKINGNSYPLTREVVPRHPRSCAAGPAARSLVPRAQIASLCGLG
jgi:DNA replication protein DnaC